MTTAEAFYRAYLLAFLLWLGITLGSMALVMLHHLVGGGWGFLIRRPLEAASRLMPLMAILSIPVFLGMPHLYPWLHAADLPPGKAAYLQTPFFILRSIIYFAIWLTVSFLLNHWSRQQDRSDDPAILRRLQLLSGPGLLLYALTMTFAAIDWVMSIDPHFYSTIFGLLFLTGQPLAAMAVAVITIALLAARPPLATIINHTYLRDLGNLLLAFTMLWAYMSFSQFLIIWAGNLPEEARWYIGRLANGWQWIGLLLIVVHFALPFALLLSRITKESLHRLVIVASIILIMRTVDIFWLIGPRTDNDSSLLITHHSSLSWMHFVLPLAMGAIWIAVYIWQLRRRPLLPTYDARLADLMTQPHGAA